MRIERYELGCNALRPGPILRRAHLINMASGALIDEKALYEELRGGKIAGAAVDVFEIEPPPSDNPL